MIRRWSNIAAVAILALTWDSVTPINVTETYYFYCFWERCTARSATDGLRLTVNDGALRPLVCNERLGIQVLYAKPTPATFLVEFDHSGRECLPPKE